MPHTPGPWLPREFQGKLYVTDSTPDRDGKFVGQIIAVETTDPNTRDNLQLIAAAPDLLAACKRSLHLVEENNEEIVKMIGSFGLLSDLQTAIAKAEKGA